MSENIEQRIAATAAKLEQLKASKRAAEVRDRAKAAKAERAADTRRKFLVGQLILDQASRNPEAEKQLSAQLVSYLTRDDDRALFNLPPVEPQAQNALKPTTDEADQARDTVECDKGPADLDQPLPAPRADAVQSTLFQRLLRVFRSAS